MYRYVSFYPCVSQPSWRIPDLEECFPEGLGGAYCLMLTMAISALSREKGEAIKLLLTEKVRVIDGERGEWQRGSHRLRRPLCGGPGNVEGLEVWKAKKCGGSGRRSL